MKKILILLLTGLLVLSAAGCAEQNPDETNESTASLDGPIDGGWGDSSSIAVSEEVKTLFDKINETMTGAYYEPIAYLSSQIVAGTNHLVLCKEIPSTANYDALGTYVIVTVYEDLERNAEITQVLYSNVVAPQPYNPETPVAGGWSEPDSYEPTEEAKAALKNASADTDYEPIALLGTQIVAGTNYMMLCRSNESYTILTVYADLQGGAEVTDVYDFTSDEAGTGEDPVGAGQASFQSE